MSRFSSKCDLWDWLGSIAKEHWDETPYDVYTRLHTELFLNDGMKPISIKKPSDLVKYYPYFDAVHLYERERSDKHWLCPPKNDPDADRFYQSALEQEYKRAVVEEDPKYV